MPTSKPIRSPESGNPDFPTTSQADLAELRRCLRAAPSKRAILIASVSALLTAIFATVAITVAILLYY